jgi:hypothetical protein
MAQDPGHSCRCGNIRIRGKPLPTGVYPNIPSSERTRLLACSSCFSVQLRGVDIADISNLSVKSQGPVCADLYCSSCRSTFRFFSGRGFCYVGRLGDSNPRETTNVPVTESGPLVFPAFLQPLLGRQDFGVRSARGSDASLRSEDGAPSGDDGDFDVMFSSKFDPVVGSYRRLSAAGEGLTFGGSGSGDNVPRSYYG